MPGIFGLACEAHGMDTAALLARMAGRLRHEPWYQESRFLDEAAGIGLGRIALDFAPGAAEASTTEDDGLVAVLDGEVYDYAAQRQALEASGHRFRTDSPAELLAHGYEAQGARFFQGLHGKFVAALWDRHARRLILGNDRFGMRPLYYAEVPGGLLFASEIKALLVAPEVSRQPNLRGIAQFFTYGQLLGEDTMLKEIRLLPAAGVLTYDLDRDALTVASYWTPPSRSQATVRTEAEHLDRIADAFDQAVARCTSGSGYLGLSLSGGLDARTILGCIDPARPVTTVCMGMDGSMDHHCAEQMARLVGRPYYPVMLDDQFLAHFSQHLERMVHLTDGHYLSQCIVMPTLPVYRNLGIQVLLRGHAGELMHMTKAYNFSLDRAGLALQDDAALEAWLFRHLQAYILDGTDGRLFAPEHRGLMADLARESLHARLQNLRAVQPPLQRLWHLFLDVRLRRETAMSMVKFGSLMETRLPHLDNDLVDALLDAPPELKLDEKIQAHILRRRQPAFLDVPNVNTGVRMGAGRSARFFGKVRQKVFAKLGVKGYQPYERLGLWLRRELRPLVGQILLDPQCLERGIFDPKTVRAVVDNHTSGRKNHTFLIMAMLIFELGQRQLLDGRNNESPVATVDAKLAS